LPFVIQFALLVYCLIDCVQTPSCQVRNLPKSTWLPLIIVVPFAGPVGWLIAGRPVRTRQWSSDQPAPATRSDDDAEFLALVEASDDLHEQMLAEWEAQLREREDQGRDRDDDSSR